MCSAVCLKCLVSFENEAYVNSPTWTRWNGALAEDKQPLGSLAASDSGDDEGTKLLRAYLHQTDTTNTIITLYSVNTSCGLSSE